MNVSLRTYKTQEAKVPQINQVKIKKRNRLRNKIQILLTLLKKIHQIKRKKKKSLKVKRNLMNILKTSVVTALSTINLNRAQSQITLALMNPTTVTIATNKREEDVNLKRKSSCPNSSWKLIPMKNSILKTIFQLKSLSESVKTNFWNPESKFSKRETKRRVKKMLRIFNI